MGKMGGFGKLGGMVKIGKLGSWGIVGRRVIYHFRSLFLSEVLCATSDLMILYRQVLSIPWTKILGKLFVLCFFESENFGGLHLTTPIYALYWCHVQRSAGRTKLFQKDNEHVERTN